MTRKNTTILALSLVALLGVASFAYADGWGYGPHMGYGRGYQQAYCNGQGYGPGNGPAAQTLTPEQQEAAQAIFDRHEEKIDTLRDQIWSRNVELQAMVNAGDRDAVNQLTAQITSLRDQLRSEHEAIAAELNDAGIESAYGSGRGFGRGGRGLGMGYGRGGNGRGACIGY